MLTFPAAASALADVGRRFYQRGWVQGTSGNFSAVVAAKPLALCITPSSAHKGKLAAGDFLRINSRGHVRAPATGKPSAETLLHLEIVNARRARAVLHTHSVWSTILSDRHRLDEGLAIEGFEMLKGLDGVRTHQHREWIPIVDNDQDMTRLSGVVRGVLRAEPAAHAVLIAGHGMYTWGRSIEDAERHVEILEFLLEVYGLSQNSR